MAYRNDSASAFRTNVGNGFVDSITHGIYGQFTTISYDFVSPGGTIEVGVLGTHFWGQAKRETMVPATAWSTDRSRDTVFQINSDAHIHILNTIKGQRYCGQVTIRNQFPAKFNTTLTDLN